jgi:tRNA (guanine37-N1)-methyltransferase
MRIDVFTLFPDIIDGFCSHSLLGRARESGAIAVNTHDIRAHTTDVHRTVDDLPYGGGAGMLMRPEPIFASVEAANPPRPLLLLGPGGQKFDQKMAHALAEMGGFSMLCGRYEGVDQRVREHLVDHEVSVGDVVLAGGEVAACLIIEAVTRLIPGVMGNSESPITESFGAEGLLEEPQYTRPGEFRGWEVPEILRSGDHAKVATWRHVQALWRTMQQRPDLIEARGGLTEAEKKQLEGAQFASYPLPFISERP